MPTIHVQTTVLPGGKLEIVSPDLPIGKAVQVTITVPEPIADSGRMGVYTWLQSLPPSSKSAEDWERFEKEFQAERDSWDH